MCGPEPCPSEGAGRMDWTTDNFRKAKWDPETEGLRGSRRALNKDKEVGKRQSVSSPKAALCTPSPSPGE